MDVAQSKSATISGIDHDTLVPLNSPIVSALYEGESWLNFQDASVSITYSFNKTLPTEYEWPDTKGWQPVASHVRDMIDEVMSITDGMILPDIETMGVQNALALIKAEEEKPKWQRKVIDFSRYLKKKLEK